MASLHVVGTKKSDALMQMAGAAASRSERARKPKRVSVRVDAKADVCNARAPVVRKVHGGAGGTPAYVRLEGVKVPLAALRGRYRLVK